MPKAWSAKRERQYEHVKQSEKKKGRSTGRAKEIAARTVNKQRAKSGETKGSSSRSRSSSSGGSSRSRSTRSSSRSTTQRGSNRSRSPQSRSRSSSSRRSSSSSRRSSSSQGPTKEQLYNRAKRMNIPGRSKMNKRQLQQAINRRS